MNPYPDSSDWNVAAVHSGLVKFGETAWINRTYIGAKPNWTGILQNGIQSTSSKVRSCAILISKI
jgi:hypothetical protein